MPVFPKGKIKLWTLLVRGEKSEVKISWWSSGLTCDLLSRDPRVQTPARTYEFACMCEIVLEIYYELYDDGKHREATL